MTNAPDIQDMYSLFAAHSPKPSTVHLRFEHYFSQDISIATLVKAPDNVLPAFSHAHEEYEFCIPLTPIPYLLNENAVYFGEIGWVFPVQSGRTHGAQHSMSDVSHHNIVIRQSYLDSFLRDKGLEGGEFNYEFRITRFLSLYIEAFQEEFRKNEAKDAHKLKHLTALICVELIDEGIDPARDTRKQSSGYQRGLHSVAEYMNANYHLDISIAEMARLCGFSPNYFSTCFFKLFGDRPHAYLHKLRISKAKIMLENTMDSIEDVAYQCGFRKTNSFTTAFKTATGLTPSAYRKAFNRNLNRMLIP